MKKLTIPAKCDIPLTGLNYLQWYSAQGVYHAGIDLNSGIGNQDCGNEVKAPAGGFVEFVEERTSYYYSRGFGKFVILLHDDGVYTRYAHLRDINIKQGDRVKKGDLIGHVGNTGTTYCHLHFECFNNAELVELQKNHKVSLLKRPWCFYPTGKHRAWVAERYLDPWKWLEEQEKVVKPEPVKTPEWAKASVEFCEAKGLIKQFEGNPINDFELAVILRRFYGAFIDKLK